MAMTKSFEKSAQFDVHPPPGLDMAVQRQLATQTRPSRKQAAKMARASKGSKNHHRGQCRPCLNVYTVEGCPKGADCNFCHCPHDKESLEQAALQNEISRLAKKQEKAMQMAAAMELTSTFQSPPGLTLEHIGNFNTALGDDQKSPSMEPTSKFQPPPGLTLEHEGNFSTGCGDDQKSPAGQPTNRFQPPGLTLEYIKKSNTGFGDDELSPLALQKPHQFSSGCSDRSTTDAQSRLSREDFCSFQSDLSHSTDTDIVHMLSSDGTREEALRAILTKEIPRKPGPPTREFDCSGALDAHELRMLRKLGTSLD